MTNEKGSNYLKPNFPDIESKKSAKQSNNSTEKYTSQNQQNYCNNATKKYFKKLLVGLLETCDQKLKEFEERSNDPNDSSKNKSIDKNQSSKNEGERYEVENEPTASEIKFFK